MCSIYLHSPELYIGEITMIFIHNSRIVAISNLRFIEAYDILRLKAKAMKLHGNFHHE